MQKLGILIILAALFTGCTSILSSKTESDKSNSSNTAQNTAEVKPAAKYNVGDTVVAKWMQNSFYEGKAESISDAKVKVKWNDGSNPTDVDKTDVFPLPKAGEKPDVKVGEIVLAKVGTGSYWNGVEVTSINGEVYVVKADGGQTSNVTAEKIIKVPADVAANFKQKASANDFIKVAQSKKPTAPDGFKPKEGEKVLGEWSTNSWYQAKVQKVTGNKATLAWEDGSKPSEIDFSKILPLPNSKTEMPKESQYLLVKPESGSKWIYAQTTSVKTGKVEINTSDNKTRSIQAGEFILLN